MDGALTTLTMTEGTFATFDGTHLFQRAWRPERPDGIGLLLCTNQPWHPQVELIARVLRNREGKPWIMRRRTQAEMDDLVVDAGFEKRAMDVDRWGIFTVSVAVRRG